MKSYFVCIAASALLIAPAFGQNLIEHAAAAAGATAGTGAGKVLSNGIDKILGKAAETGSNTGKPATVRPPATIPVEPPPPASKSAPDPIGSSGTTQHARARRSAAPVDPGKPVFAAPEPQASVPSPPAFVAPPTSQDFAKVKEGSPREDVQSALGTPSSRITIPGDDGHLLEILSYYDGNRHVGTVRMDNGVVVSVTAVP